MPVLARFNGLVIKMYFQQREHNPPHIHVIYGEHIGVVEINTLKMSEGDLPHKELILVQKWVEQNKEELLKIWDTQEFTKLPPL